MNPDSKSSSTSELEVQGHNLPSMGVPSTMLLDLTPEQRDSFRQAFDRGQEAFAPVQPAQEELEQSISDIAAKFHSSYPRWLIATLVEMHGPEDAEKVLDEAIAIGTGGSAMVDAIWQGVFTPDELQNEDSEEEPPDCSVCGGELQPLGTHGSRTHYHCRSCGLDSTPADHSCPKE